jgi:hypothetical protein
LVKKSNDTLTVQVETRLEELFGTGIELPAKSEIDDANGGDSFKELKTLLLSIDWEITDEVMAAFIEKIEKLKEKNAGDQVISWFLELLGALGKHLKTYKSKAHPNTIRVLKSVFKGLQTVSGAKTRSEAERKKILMIEVRRFKEFKKQVALGKTGAGKTEEAKIAKKKIPLSENRPEDAMVKIVKRSPEEIFIDALSEIKDLIRSEFRALKEELKIGREERH